MDYNQLLANAIESLRTRESAVKRSYSDSIFTFTLEGVTRGFSVKHDNTVYLIFTSWWYEDRWTLEAWRTNDFPENWLCGRSVHSSIFCYLPGAEAKRLMRSISIPEYIVDRITEDDFRILCLAESVLDGNLIVIMDKFVIDDISVTSYETELVGCTTGTRRTLTVDRLLIEEAVLE